MTKPLAFFALLVMAAGPARAATYLCFGDSNTAGLTGSNTDAYLGPLTDWLAANRAPATVLNQGLAGETTVDGAPRLMAVLASQTVDYVLIMEGTNDVNRWAENLLSQSTTQSNLKDMVREVKSRGAIPILATILPRLGDRTDPNNTLTQQANSIIRDVASAEGALLADVYGNVAPRANELIYRNPLHLNELGYPLAAEAMVSAIASLSVASIDLTPPLTTYAKPKPAANGVPLDTDVSITVREDKHPFDPASAVMSIDGVVVTPKIDSATSPGETSYTYNFPKLLNFGQTVTVVLDVSDTAVPPNKLHYDHSFSTAAGNGTRGDIDKSGRVDGADIAILAGAFGTGIGDNRYVYAADIDGNGVVDGFDLMLVASRFGGAP